MRVVLPLLLLVAGGAGFAALEATRPASEPVTAEERVWLVNAQTAQPASRTPTVVLFASVSSPRLASLSAAVTADVLEVAALEGQRVAAGELLLRLDGRDAELERVQREAEIADIRAQIESERQRHQLDRELLANERSLLELSERAVQRAEELASNRAGSRSQLDEARQAAERQRISLAERRFAVREHTSRLAQLEARLARAVALARKAALDESRTMVTAPFDGRVTSVEVSPGDRVRAGDVLLSMYDVNRVELRAQLPSRLLEQVRAAMDGAQTLLATAQVDGVAVSARLDRLAAQVQRGSGGIDALFRIDGDTAQLPIGRTVELELELLPVPDVVALPLEALYGTDRVFLLEEGRLREVAVQRVGERRSEDGGTQVLLRGEALVDGARVLTTQLPNAIDGLRVRVAGESPAS